MEGDKIGSELQFPERYYCTVQSNFVLTCVRVKGMIFILIYSYAEEK